MACKSKKYKVPEYKFGGWVKKQLDKVDHTLVGRGVAAAADKTLSMVGLEDVINDYYVADKDDNFLSKMVFGIDAGNGTTSKEASSRLAKTVGKFIPGYGQLLAVADIAGSAINKRLSDPTYDQSVPEENIPQLSTTTQQGQLDTATSSTVALPKTDPALQKQLEKKTYGGMDLSPDNPYGATFAYGGIADEEVNAELEKSEVFRTPDGNISKVSDKAPTHKRGGVKLQLPVGTEILGKNKALNSKMSYKDIGGPLALQQKKYKKVLDNENSTLLAKRTAELMMNKIGRNFDNLIKEQEITRNPYHLMDDGSAMPGATHEDYEAGNYNTEANPYEYGNGGTLKSRRLKETVTTSDFKNITPRTFQLEAARKGIISDSTDVTDVKRLHQLLNEYADSNKLAAYEIPYRIQGSNIQKNFGRTKGKDYVTGEDINEPIVPEFGNGGIYIKPSKRGTFTTAATKHGKSVQGFASQVLANKDNYSPAMVKKANFARNAVKWNKKPEGTDYLTPILGEEYQPPAGLETQSAPFDFYPSQNNVLFDGKSDNSSEGNKINWGNVMSGAGNLLNTAMTYSPIAYNLYKGLFTEPAQLNAANYQVAGNYGVNYDSSNYDNSLMTGLLKDMGNVPTERDFKYNVNPELRRTTSASRGAERQASRLGTLGQRMAARRSSRLAEKGAIEDIYNKKFNVEQSAREAQRNRALASRQNYLGAATQLAQTDSANRLRNAAMQLQAAQGNQQMKYAQALQNSQTSMGIDQYNINAKLAHDKYLADAFTQASAAAQNQKLMQNQQGSQQMGYTAIQALMSNPELLSSIFSAI